MSQAKLPASTAWPYSFALMEYEPAGKLSVATVVPGDARIETASTFVE
jgi:hypothetical protein